MLRSNDGDYVVHALVAEQVNKVKRAADVYVAEGGTEADVRYCSLQVARRRSLQEVDGSRVCWTQTFSEVPEVPRG